MRIQPLTDLLYLGLRAAHTLGRRPRPAADFAPAAVRTLLAVSTTALGDTAMSTAGLHALRMRYPEARLIALLHPATGRLLDGHPDIDERIFYSGRYGDFARTLGALRRLRPDAAVVFHGNEPQMTPLLSLAGIPFIFKLPNTSRNRFLLSNAEPRQTWQDLGHGLRQRLAVAHLAGADSDDPRMHLPVHDAAREAAGTVLAAHGLVADTPLVGLQTGASEPHRAWPERHYVALGRTLAARRPDLRLVLTGSPAEAARCRRIAEGIGEAAVDLAGTLGLDRLPALIERLDVLVTGDTGPMHVAIAVGTPTVCLFGASDPAGAGPLYDLDRHTVLTAPWDAAARTLPEPMSRIGVDAVAAAVLARLDLGAATGT